MVDAFFAVRELRHKPARHTAQKTKPEIAPDDTQMTKNRAASDPLGIRVPTRAPTAMPPNAADHHRTRWKLRRTTKRMPPNTTAGMKAKPKYTSVNVKKSTNEPLKAAKKIAV